MAFPTDPLDIAVQMAFGANPSADPSTWTWMDITPDVRPGVVIRRGRQNEGQDRTEPSACGLQLDNASGVYTPYQPTSLRYPNIRTDTPLQVKVGAAVRTTQLVADWQPGWADGGGGPYEGAPICDVEAAGILRRLGQGEKPLQSALYRAITTASPPAKQYWPLTDGRDSTQARSGLSGYPTMTKTGAVRFASDTDLPGSAALPDFTAGGSLYGVVPDYSVGSNPAFTVDFWVRATGTTTHVPVRFGVAGLLQLWEVQVTSTAVNVLVYNAVGTEVTGGAATKSGGYMDDRWHNVRVVGAMSGLNVNITPTVDGVAGSTYTATSQTASTVAWVQVNPGAVAGPLVSAGHVNVWFGSAVTDWNYAGSGNAGEAAGTRVQRICAENGVPYLTSGVESNTEPMGPQPMTLTGILRDCETVDGGVLYETTGGYLAYLTRRARYNPAVDLALTKARLTPGFQPTADDQATRNDVTVVRANGSSAQFVDTAHVAAHGRYDEQVTVNAASDGVLLDHAAWRVHLGTVEGLRYPRITLYLHADPDLIPAWLACDIGSRITISDPPASLPPDMIDLILIGYTETLDTFTWTVDMVCVPARPYVVATVEGTGDKLARVGSATSTLSVGINTTAMSLSVATTGNLWTTTATFPGDFPFDIEIGGERMTVTAISGTSSPQSFTVTRSVNGVVKSHLANAQVRLWKPAVVGL